MRPLLICVAAVALGVPCTGAYAQDRGLSHPANLSSAMVQDMLNAALDVCHQNKHQVSVTILDRFGQVRASFRDENASPHTLELSQRKAYTALTFRMPSADFAKRTVSDPSRAPQQNLAGVIALGGGLPIKAGDETVGAIGVSGSQGGAVVGSNDEMCGKAGIDKISDRLKYEVGYNLSALLLEREAAGRPVTVGLIGAGKFGTMFLSQARLTRGLHVVAVADLNVERARSQLATAGWPAEQFAAGSLGDAIKQRTTHVTADAEAMIAHPGIEVIVEATGIPEAGIVHALKTIEHGKHVVMVNVEADALAGPLLARKAKAAGVVYSLAWGDQPALICEHVDWARACGFKVIAAGKGTRYEPHYHKSNPDNVWDILDKYLNIADRKSINPKMFNSFVDGTKSGIEMTAVCNATGLSPQTAGLGFPPATRFELADVCKPKSAGGALEQEGVTEVTSSVYRDGRDVPFHLALGTYVVIEGETEYARRCFKEYAMLPDASGRYAALYRPIHMIGLELGISVASVALRHEPTGAPTGFRSDVAATAKRDLEQGEVLDGEGGFCVWGRQTPAADSLEQGYLPLGLAQNVRLKRDIAEGERLKWSDVQFDPRDPAVRVRREMEAAFGRQNV